MNRYLKAWALALVLLPFALALAGPRDFLVNPREPHGLVISSVDREADYIHPVFIVAVNGQELTRREDGLWLRPGVHTLKAINKGAMNRNFVPGLRGGHSEDNVAPLTLEVLAGKNYYIGLKADTGRRSDWRLVVWRVEDQ